MTEITKGVLNRANVGSIGFDNKSWKWSRPSTGFDPEACVINTMQWRWPHLVGRRIGILNVFVIPWYDRVCTSRKTLVYTNQPGRTCVNYEHHQSEQTTKSVILKQLRWKFIHSTTLTGNGRKDLLCW